MNLEFEHLPDWSPLIVHFLTSYNAFNYDRNVLYYAVNQFLPEFDSLSDQNMLILLMTDPSIYKVTVRAYLDMLITGRPFLYT